MSIIQKFLTNQIAANENINLMKPYGPKTQHLLHMQEGVNLLSWKIFGEWKCPKYLNSLWNYSHTHYSDVRRCTSKWTLGHRRKKKGGGGMTPRLPFHYPIFFFQAWQENYIFCTIFVVFSLSNELDEEYIETHCRSNVIHGLYIGRS